MQSKKLISIHTQVTLLLFSRDGLALEMDLSLCTKNNNKKSHNKITKK